MSNLIEYVVVPLLWRLEDDPGLFEEVGPHVGPDDVVVLVEVDLKVLACYCTVVVGQSYR